LISFPHVSPPKPCTHLFFFPYVPHVLPISFFLIWSVSHLLRIVNLEAPHHELFSYPLLTPPP
jgi:hypothetical protein